MKPLFIIFAFCFVAASDTCPNLAGHYLLNEDGAPRGCEEWKLIERTRTLAKPQVETHEFIVDETARETWHGRIVGWSDKLQIGPTANHVYYGTDSARNLHMSDGGSYPQCNGPCDEVAERTD